MTMVDMATWLTIGGVLALQAGESEYSLLQLSWDPELAAWHRRPEGAAAAGAPAKCFVFLVGISDLPATAPSPPELFFGRLWGVTFAVRFCELEAASEGKIKR